VNSCATQFDQLYCSDIMFQPLIYARSLITEENLFMPTLFNDQCHCQTLKASNCFSRPFSDWYILTLMWPTNQAYCAS